MLFLTKLSDEMYGHEWIMWMRRVPKGLRKKIVSETSEALSTAEEGLQNRAVAETVLNSDSSRSHSIFTIYIHGLKGSSKRPGRYSIVDLAGSERSDRTKATGSRAREANKINSSLMHLIHCIRQMRWNQTHSNSQRIVPFRETRLTRLFQESFVGSRAGKIAMVVNASTEAGDFDETLHVLKNASLARSVCITKKSKVNSWRSMASMQKYGLDGRRRKRAAEKSSCVNAALKADQHLCHRWFSIDGLDKSRRLLAEQSLAFD